MSEIAVLVASCDRYKDLWKPFFTLFFRYWSDCPHPVYLLSNHLSYPDSRVEMIAVGDDRDWSSNLRAALQQIPHRYVLLLLEDFFLDQPVDTAKIQALATYMEQRCAACLRLFTCPGPDIPCVDNPAVGEILRGSAYRLSMMAAIWDKKVLLQLLRDGETPWQLEIEGTQRTNILDVPFLSVKESAIHYFCPSGSAVCRGKWKPEAVQFCAQQGIQIDLRARPQESWVDRFLRSRTFGLMVQMVNITPLRFFKPFFRRVLRLRGNR